MKETNSRHRFPNTKRQKINSNNKLKNYRYYFKEQNKKSRGQRKNYYQKSHRVLHKKCKQILHINLLMSFINFMYNMETMLKVYKIKYVLSKNNTDNNKMIWMMLRYLRNKPKKLQKHRSAKHSRREKIYPQI